MHWRRLIASPDSSPTTARLANGMIESPHAAAKLLLVPCAGLKTRPISNAVSGQPLLLAAREACLLRESQPGHTDVITELTAALTHEDTWVRYFAVTAIARGEAGLSPRAKKSLQPHLRNASQTIDTKVAIATGWAQAATGDPEGFATLAVYLRAG